MAKYHRFHQQSQKNPEITDLDNKRKHDESWKNRTWCRNTKPESSCLRVAKRGRKRAKRGKKSRSIGHNRFADAFCRIPVRWRADSTVVTKSHVVDEIGRCRKSIEARAIIVRVTQVALRRRCQPTRTSAGSRWFQPRTDDFHAVPAGSSLCFQPRNHYLRIREASKPSRALPPTTARICNLFI